MKTKLCSYLLLCVAILAAVGCGDSGAAPTETDAVTGTSETTAAADETVNPYANNLGDFDFKGETFTMYTRESVFLNDNLDCTEADGTTLNDEIYARNTRLEDKYNFTFEEIREEANTTKARTAVIAGEDVYDIIATRCVYAFNYACEGILRPVSDLPHVDLSKPYWDKQLTEAVSVGNINYFAVGAYNISGYDFTHMLAFNKEIANQNDFGIYDSVTDGTWTFAKMQEMMKAITKDINGDGKMDESDSYGLIATPKQILPCFWIAANETSIDFDSADYPVYSLQNDERFGNIFGEIFNLAYDGNVWYRNKSDDNVNTDQVTMFINGLSLFIDMPAFHLETLRIMDTDFGLIPYPKYDEAQEVYYSRIEGCEQTCIPQTNTANLEMTSVILEAMASDSAQYLVPAYYDTLLTSKIARDNESEAMLEIVFGNRIFDWGDTIWCDELRDGQFRDMMKNDKRDLASTAAKLEKKMQKVIDETVEAFEALEQ